MWFIGVFVFVILAAWGAFMALDTIGAALSQRVNVDGAQLLGRLFWLSLVIVSCIAIGAGLDWWNLS